jgi:hypothetical protein
MFAFFSTSISNAIMWITCSPISDLLSKVKYLIIISKKIILDIWYKSNNSQCSIYFIHGLLCFDKFSSELCIGRNGNQKGSKISNLNEIIND